MRVLRDGAAAGDIAGQRAYPAAPGIRTVGECGVTVDRQYNALIFMCDQQNSARCEEALETGESEWNAAMDALRGAGWRSFPPRTAGGNWVHCCPRCTVPR